MINEYAGLRKRISRESWTKTFFGSTINTSHNFVFSQPPNTIPTNTQSVNSTTNIIDYKVMNTSGTVFSYPFEYIYTSDAFIGWAKTKTSVLEWKYHLNFL
jgi:hypothetical protein